MARWSEYAGERAIRFVRVGTLDAPDRRPPDIHIFTSSKRAWAALPEDARAVPEFRSHRETWPAESRARRVAAMEAPGLTP